MLEIKCTVPRFELIEDGANSMMQSLTLSLDEKETNCSVKGIELYKSEGEALSADVFIPYEYDSKRGMLRISAPDYEGEKVFKTAFKKNGKQIEVEALEAKEALKKWSSAYTEALYEQIVEYARENEMAILTRNNWDKQLSENIWVSYKNGFFCGLSSKEHSEEKGVKCVPLKSVEGGGLYVSKNHVFWNIVGSTKDTYPDMPPQIYELETTRHGLIGILDQWVFKYYGVQPQRQCICTMKNYIGIEENCRCQRQDIVAGHITFSEEYVKPKGDEQIPKGIIGLLPICKSHNFNPGKKIVMLKSATGGYGIWLEQYKGEYYNKEE